MAGGAPATTFRKGINPSRCLTRRRAIRNHIFMLKEMPARRLNSLDAACCSQHTLVKSTQRSQPRIHRNLCVKPPPYHVMKKLILPLLSVLLGVHSASAAVKYFDV